MTTTEQQVGFIEAICADPHDIGTRLIMADWLEERGEAERGEFIRVQVELAEGPRSYRACWENESKIKADAERMDALRRRERDLLEQDGPPVWGTKSRMVGRVWMTVAYRWLGIPLLHMDWYKFRWGFVEYVECRCADWLEHGPAIVKVQPVLEVYLTDPRDAALHWNVRAEQGPVAWARRQAGLPPLKEGP